ncbi:MAG: polysaccharide deacetylase family protein [Solirubrobacterales bacterium]
MEQRRVPERLAARRAEQRRRVRRRRLAALGGLAVGALAVVAIAVALTRPDSGGNAPGGNGGPASGQIGQNSGSASGGTDARRLLRSASGGTDARRLLRSASGGGGVQGGSAGMVRNATPQPGWGPHPGPVPILAYHVLGAPPPGTAYPGLYTGRTMFSRQMDWLDRHGYQAVTLDEVQRAWYEDGTLPRKPIVISFDDGYRPQFTFALPELRRHGWPGVLNLKAEGSDLYTSNVEAMIGAGWELASHTTHHLDLTTLDAAGLREELQGSRAILRREYGVPVDNFCYPSGRFDAAAEAAVEAAGYRGATTEVPGYASSDRPYALDRFEVLRTTGVAGLAQMLSQG